MSGLTLRWHARPLGIARGPDAVAEEGPIYGRLTTRTGTTLIVPYEHAGPDAVGPFRALEVEGPLDFALTGVLVSLLEPLARARISVFTLSTFETDWVLIRTASTEAAARALAAVGHTIEEWP